MYAERGYYDQLEMQLQYQDLSNPTMLVTIPKIAGTGLNQMAAIHAALARQYQVLNTQF